MKKHMIEFLKRGLMFSVGGPVVLAIVYGILGATGAATTLTTWEACRGILTVSLLAFIVAGCTVLYQIERLSLFAAVLIHGTALYLTYILIYLINGWLKNQLTPILIFTGIFVLGYLAVWAVIYSTIKKDTAKLNEILKKKQQSAAEER